MLENEIVTDLLSEFGHLPERPEECSLDQLAGSVQHSFDGKPGTVCLSLIAKMAASKMPGGFGLASCRDYMETRWGLQEGHQTRVLLRAVLRCPSVAVSLPMKT